LILKHIPASFDIPGFIRRARLPTGFGHSGNLTQKRQLAETEPAQIEFPQIAARPATTATSISVANLELGFLDQLRHH
jgi:hypothetical protein